MRQENKGRQAKILLDKLNKTPKDLNQPLPKMNAAAIYILRYEKGIPHIKIAQEAMEAGLLDRSMGRAFI